MTKSQLSVLVSGLALALGITFAVGCSGNSGGSSKDTETAGQLGTNEATYGCSNMLIRERQAACAYECPNTDAGVGVSQGLKYCKTTDPSGAAGTVDAPCACTTGGWEPVDFPVICGELGQTCCSNRICGAGLACDENEVCATP